MKTHFLQTQKTARYVTLGDLNNQTQEIWILLHGYAQLVSEFIQPFEFMSNSNRFMIAPEGLNKFYAKGFGGKPAATWMTSECRESEIADYIYYLNQLYTTLQLDSYDAKIILLGFSQGVATASRWLQQTPFKIDAFVIYAGEIASELQRPIDTKLSSIPILFVTGNKDKLIAAEKLNEVKLQMKNIGARQIEFEGGHEITSPALNSIMEWTRSTIRIKET